MKNTEFDPIDLHSAYSQENTSIDLSCEKCAESDNSTSQFAEQGQDTEKRTSVLSDNVSRETILSGKNPRKMYKLFKKDGMGKLDSLYNAIYLSCHNRYNETSSAKKDKYKNIPEHPKGWSQDKQKVHKNNVWSCALKALDGFAKLSGAAGKVKQKFGRVFRNAARIPHRMDNSIKAAKSFSLVMARSVLPVCAVLFAAYTAVTISSHLKENYAVAVYVDGQYAGTTLNISDLLNSKKNYESDLSKKYATPVVLDCSLELVPVKVDEDNVIVSGDTSVFEKYLDAFTAQGYGLYIDGKLAAVTKTEKWFYDAISDYIDIQRNSYIKTITHDGEEDDDEVVEQFVYDNNITVIADKYPESYFLSRSQVRELFSLPVLSDDDAKNLQSNLHFVEWDDFEKSTTSRFTYSLKLDYSNLSSSSSYNTDSVTNEDAKAAYQLRAARSAELVNATVPAETVSVDIVVIKEEKERAVIPYSTEYIYDDEMPEGMRRLVQNGKDGEEIITYKATYRADKLLKRDIAAEQIITEPVSKIVRVGTKELTEEEKALIPTGTYIYPYQGKISSYFGWRVLGGQNNFHQGLDICGTRGDPVVAADGGEVIEVGYTSGYGLYCKIRHNEDIVTRYAHCDSIDVEVGDLVGQGFQIGTLGDTGNATGVHVHFEIIDNGVTVDPLPYMTGSLPYAY